ncbi:MAG: CDP-diacylglycerol--glycerol-3-phosphate 3-phosphatidyltransferase [Clostridia bacterium]|nr:CDP-diacylglycerol--glycerol-3-phosphate 3-phosphatidyltransferase [Clostridia bacterium]
MNLPNKLTVFRIILVPIMVIIPYLNIQGQFLGIPVSWLIIDAIFIIASITDKLDGSIARSRNMVTNFGKFLDPIADKILVLAAMVMLVEMNKLPAWIPIIVLFREFVVSGYRLIAVEQGGKVIAASIWGKIKTATQMVAIILAFIDKFGFGKFIFRVGNEAEQMVSSAGIYMNTPQFILNIAVTVLMSISVIAAIFSGWDYIKGGKDLLKDM